jgi:hypothetical protein
MFNSEREKKLNKNTPEPICQMIDINECQSANTPRDSQISNCLQNQENTERGEEIDQFQQQNDLCESMKHYDLSSIISKQKSHRFLRSHKFIFGCEDKSNFNAWTKLIKANISS